MTPKDIKRAYNAQREIQRCEDELERIRSIEDSYKKHYSANEQSMNQMLHIFSIRYGSAIKILNERIREQQPIVDEILAWSKNVPEVIQQIVKLRVLDSKSWAEISDELFNSQEQNVSYMRLKRYLDSSQV